MFLGRSKPRSGCDPRYGWRGTTATRTVHPAGHGCPTAECVGGIPTSFGCDFGADLLQVQQRASCPYDFWIVYRGNKGPRCPLGPPERRGRTGGAADGGENQRPRKCL